MEGGSNSSTCPSVSYSTFKTILEVLPLNGGNPHKQIYNMTPRLHMSHSLPYERIFVGFNTSGATISHHVSHHEDNKLKRPIHTIVGRATLTLKLLICRLNLGESKIGDLDVQFFLVNK